MMKKKPLFKAHMFDPIQGFYKDPVATLILQVYIQVLCEQ